MLPKPEKIKKKSSAEQLDLVESISSEDKVKQKRRVLFITLLATVGLSFLFWSYRFIQTFSFSNFSFSLPQINLPIVQSSDPQKQLDNDLNQLLSPHPERWHISVTSPKFQWSYNTTAFDSVTPKDSLNLIKSVLPDGIDIKEVLTTDNPSFLEYNALISLPQGKFSIIIKNDNHDLEKFKSTIPLIVENLYWSLLKSL